MDQTSELGLPVFLILCGVLGMLLLAIAIIVFFLVYQKRLFTQQQNLLRLEQDYQKNLLQYSFEAEEAERKRIASDLHDEIGSTLSASRIYIHQLQPELQVQRYQELKTELTTLIDNAIDRIRGISHNLFPHNLERFGFLQATQDFCRRIEKIDGLQLEFTHENIPSFPPQHELALYRILQELVNNTLKHAKATQLSLHLKQQDALFTMTYQDNGQGFDSNQQTETAKGLGLKSIESRASSIGARGHFQSQSGEGMQFELRLAQN